MSRNRAVVMVGRRCSRDECPQMIALPAGDVEDYFRDAIRSTISLRMSESVSFHPSVVDQDPVRVSLDCLREGFQIIGFDWTYVYVNPAAARHGRSTPEELIGKPLSAMYPGIERSPLFEILRKCMAERSSRLLEYQFTFPDGSRRCSPTCSPASR